MISFLQYFQEEQSEQPYEGLREYYAEQLSLLDMFIDQLLEDKGGVPERGAFRKGLVITEKEMRAYQETDPVLRHSTTRNPLFVSEVERARFHVERRVAASEKEGGENLFPLEQLVRLFHLDFYGRLAILLGLASHLDLKYDRLFGFLQDDIHKRTASAGLLDAMLQSYVSALEPFHLYDMFAPDSALEKLLFTQVPGTGNVLLRRPLLLQDYVVDFLLRKQEVTGQTGTSSGESIPGAEGSEPVFFEEQLREMELIYRAGGNGFILLQGPSKCGKKTTCRQFAERMGKPLYVIAAGDLAKAGTGAASWAEGTSSSGDPLQTPGAILLSGNAALLRTLFLHCINPGILLIPNLERLYTPEEAANGRKEEPRAVSRALAFLRSKVQGPIFLTGDEHAPASMLGECVQLVSFREISVRKRAAMWQYFAQQYVLDESVDLEEMADIFESSCGIIAHIFQTAHSAALLAGESAIRQQHLTEAAVGFDGADFGTMAQRVRTVFTWDDIELGEHQKEILKTACRRYKFRNRVSENWGLKKKNPYGNGVSILLYGPPGSGKTMAAQVIAREVGLQLFRVDVSQIFSKYIGETQKNIAAIFAAAQKANVVLFFDEADALFAKRTDVNNSNDKHANAETGFLLQKMEEYKGISVLATNLFQQFDAAFVRRITYAARFENPDAATRLNLWKGILPKETPMEANIDFDFLAQNFELSGSNIKAILYGAAYMAAAENAPISGKHIVKAMRYEFEKLGKMVSQAEFGPFAYFFDGF